MDVSPMELAALSQQHNALLIKEHNPHVISSSAMEYLAPIFKMLAQTMDASTEHVF